MNITITELIKEQIYDCLIMFCAGIAFMVAYQFCSFISRQIHMQKWIRLGAEILFWLAAAVMVSEFLYYCSHGKISVHSIGAFAVGLLLWKKFFYDIIQSYSYRGTKGLKKKYGEKKTKSSVSGQQPGD